MRRDRPAKIGTTWLSILRAVSKAGRCTAVEILHAAIPRSKVSRDALVRWMNGHLGRMAKAGYLTRIDGSPTSWTIGEAGSLAIASSKMSKYRRYKTCETQRLLAQQRRDSLRESGLCINGAKHGRATHGCRCDRCRDTHTKSA